MAILDTGIAYRNWRQFHRSPDFNRTRFVDPTTSSASNRFPLDRNGHGTFVAGVVAESTNNGIGLDRAGVRRLDHAGARARRRAATATESTIARGVRYAVRTARR